MSSTTTCPGESEGASRTRSTYASNTALIVLPSTARQGPIPPEPMLAKRVVFLPRFLGGAFPNARSPLGALARSGASPTFVAHSSTKTSLLESSRVTRSRRQRARAFSSRSEAPTVFACRSTQVVGGSPGSSWPPRPARRPHAPTARGALRGSPRWDALRAAPTARGAPGLLSRCSCYAPARA